MTSASLPVDRLRAWWRSEAPRRWAVFCAAYLAAYGLWLLARPEGDGLHWVVGQLAQLPLGVWAARAALAVRDQAGLTPRARRVWAFLGLAMLLWLAGSGLWAGYRLITGQRPPLPALADPVYMAGHLVTLAALLSFAVPRRGQFGRFRVVLDLFTLSGAGLALGWALLLEPMLSGLALSSGETLWSVVYTVLDLGLLILLINWGQALEPAEARPAVGWVMAGLIAIVVADLAYTFLSLRGQLDAAVFDLGRLLGWALLGLGARGQLQSPGLVELQPAARRWLTRLQASLPLAAGIALGWFTVLDWRATGQLNPVMAWMTALTGVALIARQGVLAGEVELSQYAQLVESAADPAFICDVRGRLRLANPALAAAVGQPNLEALMGQPLLSLLAPETVPAELRVPPRGLSALVLETGWSGEVRLRRSDGSDFPIYLALRPVAGDPGAQLLLAGTAHDLSVQKRQQAALVEAYEAAAAARQAMEQLNAELEARVEEKTRSLSDAYTQLAEQNEALKTLDQLKSEFVSLVSHELRAPLTNIAGGMELVALGPDLGPRTREHLALVQAEIRRLSRFVETILDVSALEAGRLPLTPAPLELTTLVPALQAQWASAPGGYRLRLQLPAQLPPVLADERALASVLFHLVDNALKYAPEGWVTLAVEAQAQRVRICVSDQGPGIPPEQRAAIFERFQRLNTEDAQAVYGHGLGLYMVRQLLRAMASEIVVGEAPEGGAQFAFELPVALSAD